MKKLIRKKLKNSLNIFFIALIGLTGFSNVCAELIPNTNMSVHFESGSIVGTGRSINMHRVPVIDIGTGTTTFYDASFEFTFTSGIGLEFVRTSSVAISPPLSSSNLIPGTYKGGNYTYVLDSPSSLPDNRLLYTLVGSSFSVNIITGSANNHPDIGARPIAGSLSDSLVYGLIAAGSGNSSDTPISDFPPHWPINGIVGVRQTGNTLSLSLFSLFINREIVDHSSPKMGYTLTKIEE